MCWSLSFLEDLIIRIIILCAIIAIIKILVPWILSLIGGISAPIVQILYIILWAIVAIWCVIICFELFECLVGAGGFSIMPHRTG
jgi:hypothetical protein